MDTKPGKWKGIPNRSICGGQRRRGTDSEEDKVTRCTRRGFGGRGGEGLGQEVRGLGQHVGENEFTVCELPIVRVEENAKGN